VKTNVYVDGLNLYYGCLKDTRYKWLDLACLCRYLLPRDEIQRIKYFTAIVRAFPHDPDAPTRQETYLRALATIPNLTIHYGHFLSSRCTMVLASSKSNPPEKVEVIKTEEKGSDVNLATHLLLDGFRRDYECAVVVSNDSDLLEPIRVIRCELGLPVGLINPHRHPSAALVSQATFIKQIRPGLLAKCQFPDTLTDANGTFHKPLVW
jgi:uncharacterized LabA/DUF88 family protein